MSKELKAFNNRLESLRTDRGNFMNLWGELSEYHLHYRGRFLSNNGPRNTIKRNTAVYNNKSKMAARTLASGMMTGITSPARPWFKLGSGNPELDEYRAVKEWLHTVERMMYRIFSAANFYNNMHTMYTELGVFGTGSMGIYEDYENVIRCKSYTIGSYMLDLDGSDVVDTQYCETQRSVGQLVKQFGIDKCSTAVQQMWKNGKIETMVDIVHAIEPNDDRNEMSPFAQDMKFRSVYYEKSVAGLGENQFLLKSGFKSFPIMAPRWDIAGEEVYGSDCPGMTCLGDTKALQLGEKRYYQALDKLGNPPLQGSAQVAAKTGESVPPPGSVTILGANDVGLSSIYGNYRPDINAIWQNQERTEQRISTAFYEDLFLMMIQSDRRQITATEVAERHEEKLLALGPVLERLHNELLDRVIDRTFEIMIASGIVPPAPKELQGHELAVEYISILAQAQRMVAVQGIERTANFAATLAAVWPAARHKFDAAQAIDEYGHAMGISPKIIRGDDEAEELAGAEAQQMQQAAQVQQAEQMAGAVQKAAGADMEGNNALTNTLRGAGLA